MHPPVAALVSAVGVPGIDDDDGRVGKHLTLCRHADLIEDLAHERTILFVSGDEEVDVLRRLGFAATGPAGGPAAWKARHAHGLEGADVVILPVNSTQGRAWAAVVGHDLCLAGARVRMLALVAAIDADVVDWITAGGTRKQLDHALDRALSWADGDAVPIPLGPSRFRLFTIDDLESMPPLEWLVGDSQVGIFPESALVALFGAPGAGKSFLAADLACTVACRRDDVATSWFGNTVRRGSVLYVAAEGGRGFRHRIIAWRHRRGIERRELALAFVLEPVNLFGKEDVSHILRTADLLSEPPALVVFDTVARCAVGADENSAQDMGFVVDHAERVKRETGATVLLVHHAKKDSDIERGSSSMRGAVDTLCLVREDEDNGRILSCEKQKDAEEFAAITFYLAAVGDSCVVSAQAPIGSTALTAPQRAALKTLIEVFPNGATATEWLRSSGVPDRTFYRVRARLVAHGYVAEIERGNSTRYNVQPSGHWALNGHPT